MLHEIAVSNDDHGILRSKKYVKTMKKTSPLFLRAFLALAPMLSFGAYPALAQYTSKDWALVTETNRASTPYFLDTNVGFTFATGIYDDASGLYLSNTSPELERTTDGGVTWTQLPFFDSIGCSITQLCFVSLQHGYAATSYGWNFVNTGIYETTDQGNTWENISPPGLAFSGVYATSSSIFASEATTANVDNAGFFFGATGEILYSRDDGQRWDSITQVAGIPPNRQPQFQFIYGNRDSLVATVYFNDSSYRNGGEDAYLVFSTDLGQSWQSSFIDSAYRYPIVTLQISPHTCTIIRQYIDVNDYPDSYTSFFEALPPYTEWDPSLVAFPTGAWITGNACAMYLCENEKVAPPMPAPMRRSTNNGASWSPLDSEELSADEFDDFNETSWQNLSVVGYGAVVYAINIEGELIKTTDGGDGALSATALAPRLAFGRGFFASGTDTLTMTECSSSSMFVHYQNLSCAITKLSSISIDGLDSSEYSWTSTNHNDCLSLPDTTTVFLAPHDTGTYAITVNANFIDDEYQTISVPTSFTLQVTPGTQPITLSLDVKSANITTAPSDTLDIPVYLDGTATLDSTDITLPFGLDTNVLRPVGFHSAMEGLTSGDMIFTNAMVIVPLQASGLTVSGETLIGSFRCVVYLADTLQTSVTFSGATLNVENTPCIALSLSSDSVNIAISACGDETLLQFMKTDSLSIAILSIAPNPAMDALQIGLLHPTASAISYQVLDALGETRLSGVTAADALSLDVSSLPQGVYFFRATSVDGIQTGKQFVIMR
jgi:hypothetical protein